MYNSVTGLGASLRDDDMVAARWLYPDGSSTPPPAQIPAARSSLSVSPSGNNADLTWNDNAGNETSQSAYLALGSGAFSKVGDVGANVERARISSLGTAAAFGYRVGPSAWSSCESIRSTLR